LIAGRSELATALLSELARALGEKLGPGIQKAFASLLGRLGELAPIAGAGIDLATGSGAGKIVSAGITWSSKAATAQTTGPTLEELRERLRSLLRALKDKRILVIIDDLDRLMPNEAKEMIGLVKSLGDLPNVIYLLSYDEKNLTKLISHTTPLDGHNYLKKIVQYPIHLPPISRGGLAKIFDADLSEILPPLDSDQKERIGYTWQYIFKHYLTTPRDVRLYINSLAVSLSSQKDHVDPIDLILLELLRLHEPELYFWIVNHIEELAE
jgi:predicted KAP-like P-loop ATPase